MYTCLHGCTCVCRCARVHGGQTVNPRYDSIPGNWLPFLKHVLGQHTCGVGQGQFAGVSSLPIPRGFQDLNLNGQTWQQMPLPAEASCWHWLPCFLRESLSHWLASEPQGVSCPCLSFPEIKSFCPVYFTWVLTHAQQEHSPQPFFKLPGVVAHLFG